ncbi:MAG: membrane protein insertase YidC [Desulfohalobiaceae bacterium]
MTDSWRVILALVLSLLVLVLWNVLFPPAQQAPVDQGQEQADIERQQEEAQEEKQDTGQSQEKEDLEPAGAEELQELEYQPEASDRVSVETPLYKAVFSARGGVLQSFLLKQYKQSIKSDSKPIELVTSGAQAHAPLGLLLDGEKTWEQGDWSLQGEDMQLEKGEEGRLVLQGNLDGLQLQRELTFQADSYAIQEKTVLLNKSEDRLQGELGLNIASKKLVENESRFNRTDVIYLDQEGLQKEDDTDTLQQGLNVASVKWAGIGSNYFMLAAVPVDTTMPMQTGYQKDIYLVTLEDTVEVSSGVGQEMDFAYYLGPKEDDYLQGTPNDLGEALNYGWLNIIASPLVKVLNFFYGYVGNYGLAIIMLTIVIKILFWPLSHKSYKSMEKMKKLQPMMKELKEKYKDDRQKMNQEVMRLYKTYKVNPAGGCLPMLLQIPVFIALYEALLGAVELRHASFIPQVPFTDIVWLADLSSKDPLYVTPVLMGASMFLQQKLSPTSGDPTQAKIMMIMPIVLTFIFLNFPAGLVVYFITNNLLSMLQQWWVLRKA